VIEVMRSNLLRGLSNWAAIGGAVLSTLTSASEKRGSRWSLGPSRTSSISSMLFGAGIVLGGLVLVGAGYWALTSERIANVRSGPRLRPEAVPLGGENALDDSPRTTIPWGTPVRGIA
jgi:hypothetical protein